jgi:hypothetical protein
VDEQTKEDAHLCGVERCWCFFDDAFEGGSPCFALFIAAGLLGS